MRALCIYNPVTSFAFILLLAAAATEGCLPRDMACAASTVAESRSLLQLGLSSDGPTNSRTTRSIRQQKPARRGKGRRQRSGRANARARHKRRSKRPRRRSRRHMNKNRSPTYWADGAFQIAKCAPQAAYDEVMKAKPRRRRAAFEKIKAHYTNMNLTYWAYAAYQLRGWQEDYDKVKEEACSEETSPQNAFDALVSEHHAEHLDEPVVSSVGVVHFAPAVAASAENAPKYWKETEGKDDCDSGEHITTQQDCELASKELSKNHDVYFADCLGESKKGCVVDSLGWVMFNTCDGSPSGSYMLVCAASLVAPYRVYSRPWERHWYASIYGWEPFIEGQPIPKKRKRKWGRMTQDDKWCKEKMEKGTYKGWEYVYDPTWTLCGQLPSQASCCKRDVSYSGHGPNWAEDASCAAKCDSIPLGTFRAQEGRMKGIPATIAQDYTDFPAVCKGTFHQDVDQWFDHDSMTSLTTYYPGCKFVGTQSECEASCEKVRSILETGCETENSCERYRYWVREYEVAVCKYGCESRTAACSVPSNAIGYDFGSLGGILTKAEFSPEGVTCKEGFTGSVGYIQCAEAGTEFTVYGCSCTSDDACGDGRTCESGTCTWPKIKCGADHGTTDACCNQGWASPVHSGFICPKLFPTCSGYLAGRTWGTCS
eukprot:TRINITY_DN27744_c0_g1_i1.p1 TRINITY_DN27744_c0_g1~~TRINITY_DN27744_c0_g1_i1.p1  ORF type:complete len:655 (+),score=60.42 TRINITY_DN27744_c0_g1_i1:89-2053(+)